MLFDNTSLEIEKGERVAIIGVHLRLRLPSICEWAALPSMCCWPFLHSMPAPQIHPGGDPWRLHQSTCANYFLDAW